MYYVLAVLTLAICLYTILVGKKQYQAFAKLKTTPERIRCYRRWILESWLTFGLFATIAIFILGKPTNLLHPIVNTNLTYAIPAFVRSDPDAMAGFIGGFAVGVIALVASIIIRARKTLKSQIAGTEGFSALLPRNAIERRYGVAMAFTAGINEELFFRALVPVVGLGLLHNISLAIGLSVLVFGLAHIYQGWKGVLMTTFLGWVLMKLFLLSGNIIAPMAFHTFIDLNALIVLPTVARWSVRSERKRT